MSSDNSNNNNNIPTQQGVKRARDEETNSVVAKRARLSSPLADYFAALAEAPVDAPERDLTLRVSEHGGASAAAAKDVRIHRVVFDLVVQTSDFFRIVARNGREGQPFFALVLPERVSLATFELLVPHIFYGVPRPDAFVRRDLPLGTLAEALIMANYMDLPALVHALFEETGMLDTRLDEMDAYEYDMAMDDADAVELARHLVHYPRPSFDAFLAPFLRNYWAILRRRVAKHSTYFADLELPMVCALFDEDTLAMRTESQLLYAFLQCYLDPSARYTVDEDVAWLCEGLRRVRTPYLLGGTLGSVARMIRSSVLGESATIVPSPDQLARIDTGLARFERRAARAAALMALIKTSPRAIATRAALADAFCAVLPLEAGETREELARLVRPRAYEAAPASDETLSVSSTGAESPTTRFNYYCTTKKHSSVLATCGIFVRARVAIEASVATVSIRMVDRVAPVDASSSSSLCLLFDTSVPTHMVPVQSGVCSLYLEPHRWTCLWTLPLRENLEWKQVPAAAGDAGAVRFSILASACVTFHLHPSELLWSFVETLPA